MAQTVEVCVEYLFTSSSGKAIQVRCFGENEKEWLPVSQIEEELSPDIQEGDNLILTIPEWLAYKKGLI